MMFQRISYHSKMIHGCCNQFLCRSKRSCIDETSCVVYLVIVSNEAYWITFSIICVKETDDISTLKSCKLSVFSSKTFVNGLPSVRRCHRIRLDFCLSFIDLDYLLSNNHINHIITHRFDFSDEEITAYYISFLKTLSLKLSISSIHFFFSEVGWRSSMSLGDRVFSLTCLERQRFPIVCRSDQILQSSRSHGSDRRTNADIEHLPR